MSKLWLNPKAKGKHIMAVVNASSDFDLVQMYELGWAFRKTGEINFIEDAIKNRSRYQNAAGMVNLAFACELF